MNNSDSHQLKIQKSKRIAKRLYIYKKRDTLQKARQFALLFYSQKAIYFTLNDFHENVEIDIYIYIKRMTLCVTRRFYMKKSRHFEKSKTICVHFLIHKNPDTLRYAIFHGFLKFAEEGDIFINKKQCTFR